MSNYDDELLVHSCILQLCAFVTIEFPLNQELLYTYR
jgi:hypothetical protein